MLKPKLAMIVAATSDGSIGYKNTIPWKIKGDLANFKQLTMGMPVIMGRKTQESIGKPLEGRVNIVITSGVDSLETSNHSGGVYSEQEVYYVPNFDEAVSFASKFGTEWVYFIGGARVYEEAMEIVERVHLTLVYKEGEYDTKIKGMQFPEKEWTLDMPALTVLERDPVTGIPSPSHSYLVYNRKSAEG